MKTKLLLLFALLSSAFSFAQTVLFDPPFSANVTDVTADIGVKVVINNATSFTYKVVSNFNDFPYVQAQGYIAHSAGTRYLNNTITGLEPGKLYYYRYTAVNIQNNTVSVDGQFTTLPGAPQISAITSTPSDVSAAINYTLKSTVNTGATSIIRYGINGSFTNVQPGISIANKATLAGNTTLTGLLPNTQYNYQIESTNTEGTTISTLYNFTTTTPILKFDNLSSSAITNTTATVSVDLVNVCQGANYHLQYSKTSDYAPTADELKSSGGTAGTKNHNLTGLSPNTKYYYRFYSAPNEACNNTTVYSVNGTFITTGPVEKPTISAVTAAPGGNSATIAYTLTANYSPTTSVIKYGLTANALTNSVIGFSTTDVTAKAGNTEISGLIINTVYYYQIEATNAVGTTSLGAVGSFTTGFFTNLQATAITETSATLGFTITNNCYNPSYFLQYSASPNFTNSGSSVVYSAGVKNVNVTGLLPGTTYYYRIEASPMSSTQGNQPCFPIAKFSEVASFTTVAYTTPTFTQVAPICVGGTLAALPLSSTNNITGTWAPALNNNVTTTYTFTPTAGQSATTTTMIITVNTTPTITPTFAAIPTICTNSVVTPFPTTSTNGIQGTWSPAPNNQVATNYTFTPNAGQCAVMISATVAVAQPVTPIFNSVTQICIGSTLAPLPTTSFNGIVGTWSPALNNMETTTYTFTPAAGQGCTPTTLTTLTITVDTGRIPAFTQRTPICSGEIMAALPTSSNNGVPGVWSPALNNTTTTEYTFTPSAFPGLCSSTVLTKMTIVVNATPDVPSGNPTQQLTSGATLAALMVTPANVIWYASSANATSGINALPTTTSLISGSTYYAVNVLGNCRSAAFAVTISPDLSNESFSALEVSLYPNPVNDILHIDTAEEIKLVTVFGILGNKVLTSTSKEVNVSSLSKGIYIVKIQDADNNVSTKKIIKE